MIKLFTHTDLDGVGCAVLAKLAFGNDVEIEYCGYENIDERVLTFISEVRYDEVEAVYITDISVSEDTAKLMEDTKYSDIVRLFDHHKTAEHLNKYDWCFVTEEIEGIKTCGTELFYKHLLENDLIKNTERFKTFVWAVTMYDTWAWKKLDEEEGLMVKELNDILYILGRDEFIDRRVRRKNVKGDDAMVAASKDERLLLDQRQKEIDVYINKKDGEIFFWPVNVENNFYKGQMIAGIVFADRYISELGNTLCEKNIGCDFIMIVEPGARKVHYRTIKPNVDVSKIAATLGGGGHKAAAGHVFDSIVQDNIVRAILGVVTPDDMVYDAAPDKKVMEEVAEKKPWYKALFGGNK